MSDPIIVSEILVILILDFLVGWKVISCWRKRRFVSVSNPETIPLILISVTFATLFFAFCGTCIGYLFALSSFMT
jgi:hypothetical protein